LSIKKQTVQLIWYKRDLRIVEHEPLAEATKIGKILPVYILEPEYWKLSDSSRRHWCFIYDSLVDLRDELKSINLPLIIRIGEVTDVLEHLRKEIGMISLSSYEETGNDWTYRRDQKVAQWCKFNNIPWKEYPANGVVRRLNDRDNWSKIRNQRISLPIIPTPLPLNLDNTTFKKAETENNFFSEELPSKYHPMFGCENIGKVQEGGRKAGLNVLKSFLNDRSRSYLIYISKPGISARYCSRLSAHIAFGTLSIREIEQHVKAKIFNLAKATDAITTLYRRNLNAFLSRLAWRCHFVQKFEQQPEIEFKCMHSAFEGMREDNFREDYFNAWRNGTTGYPLVDACMRSLKENGWITFRMRAMIVSFASYNLWLDWRRTAPELARLFTDYEPGIHYSQFQMQSGVTGINAYRIYNPIKQSYEHDPEGKFIKRYIPELKDTPSHYIHEPWKMGKLPQNYYNRIIEYDSSVKIAKLKISNILKTAGYKETAEAVYQKLGSRKKREPNKIKMKKKSSRQLSFNM
jgi:deoxyribodipyrimidine photo-lyase